MVSTDRQSVGYEIIWQQKGISQRADTPKNCWPLGHPSMQLIQVKYKIIIYFYWTISQFGYILVISENLF